MYLPEHFRLDDPEQQLALMRRHAFATVVATIDGAPEAAHLPLLVERADGRVVIHGHVSRANALARAGSALAIFAGPHAYVSSAWYGEKNTVPTWNYLAVHASGPLRWIDDAATERALFARLTEESDAANAAAVWRDLDDAAFYRLRRAIAWFRLDAVRVEGKAKLSQNHTPARRARVVAQLRAGGDRDQLAIADAMVKLDISA